MGFLESWYEDNISGKDGEYKGRGFGAAILKPFVDEEKIESRVQGARNRQTATSLGYDLSELDGITDSSTTLDVQGAAIKRGKADKKTEKEGDKNTQLEILRQTQAPGLEESRATNQRLLQQGNNQMQLGLAQLTQSNNQFMAQMADSKDQRAMELQIRREELDRADARDERNRRRDSIAALTSGLAALGAAFAL